MTGPSPPHEPPPGQGPPDAPTNAPPAPAEPQYPYAASAPPGDPAYASAAEPRRNGGAIALVVATALALGVLVALIVAQDPAKSSDPQQATLDINQGTFVTQTTTTVKPSATVTVQAPTVTTPPATVTVQTPTATTPAATTPAPATSTGTSTTP